MGTMSLACLLLAVSALPPDVTPMNDHSFQIPVRIDEAQRTQIRELVLFVSKDKGKTWNQNNRTSPTDPAFNFFAQEDGEYWFSICVVGMDGSQDPPSPYKGQVNQKILVDTHKPDLIVSHERKGDEILVKWEVREENPDLSTLKLEYRFAEPASASWSTVAINPTPVGSASFRPGSGATVFLKMQVKDAVGNLATYDGTSPGTGATTTSNAGPAPSPVQDRGAPSPFPGPVKEDRAWEPIPSGPAPQPVRQEGPPKPPQQEWNQNPPVTPGLVSGGAVVAVSGSKGNGPAEGPAPAPAPVGPRPGVAQLPPLVPVNMKKVPIEFEVTKFGPSGVKSVEVYVTRDDGRNWQLYGEATDLGPGKTMGDSIHHTLQVELPTEGVYGFYLIAKSGVDLHKPPPGPGTPPQMRVELDLTPPEAELYKPEPEPGRRDVITFPWKAQDHNLAARPIKLEWAERKEGPWNVIATDLPNVPSRHTWELPKTGLPSYVYLRLTVYDAAGNFSEAMTPEPIPIDPHTPDINVVRVAVPGR